MMTGAAGLPVFPGMRCIYLSDCGNVWMCVAGVSLFLSPVITAQSGPAAVILLQTPEGRGEGLILGRH